MLSYLELGTAAIVSDIWHDMTYIAIC
jgi:hypothetical protein